MGYVNNVDLYEYEFWKGKTNEKFWKELIRLLPLHYLTILINLNQVVKELLRGDTWDVPLCSLVETDRRFKSALKRRSISITLQGTSQKTALFRPTVFQLAT
jgi:hypothetical protein